MAEAIYTLPETPAPALAAADAEGTYTYNGQHAEQMAANLIEFFRKPRNKALMRVVGGQVQDVEDVLWQLYNAFDVDNATGAALDFLGLVVGERRDDRGDENFRAAVRARILVNLSNGRVEDMIAVLLALDPDMQATIIELYPAAVRFDVISTFAGASAETMARMLRQAKPAGVRLTFVPVDSDDTMIWSSPGAPAPLHGWGEDWAGAL
ncbi:MAG: Shewanella sp [Pseudomonadota bacterium]|jgi:hypothetical protein